MTRKIVLDIKALRKEKNMTISELANRLNKTIFEIKVWEDNGHKVSIKDLDSLHQILGFSINYVVFNNERNILSVRGLTVKQIEYIKLDRDKSTFKSHRDFCSEKEITFKHL